MAKTENSGNERPAGGLTAKQERGIAALLEWPTITEAAKRSGLSEPTLRRWMNDPAFAEAYKAARVRVWDGALDALQSAAGAAVASLRDIAQDANAQASARVSAAKAILEIGLRLRESLDLEARMVEIENKLGVTK